MQLVRALPLRMRRSALSYDGLHTASSLLKPTSVIKDARFGVVHTAVREVDVRPVSCNT